MQAQVFNVTPVQYGEYSARGSRDAATWSDGSVVEWVDVLDNEGQSRRMTLRQGMNGDRAPVGVLCDFDVLIARRQFVTYRRDGSEQIRDRESYRVVEMRPVEAPAVAKAA